MMQHKPTRLFLAALMLVLMAGCNAQSPITVFVTPTLPPTDTPTAAATATATFTLVPTMEPQAQPSPTVSETPVPTATLTPVGSPVFVGPIIGPGYVVPPSATPVPTATPEGAELTPTQTPPPAATTAPEATAPPPTEAQTQVVPVLPNLDPNQLGIQLDINLDDQDWNEAMGRIEQLGFKWVKVQLPWRDMQPNGPDERDNEFFRRIEQHLEDANNRGLNMLVSVVKAPAWARSVQAEDGPPDDPATLARFITIIFEEFNAGLNAQMVGDYIDAIEIWNEPNLQREWQGTLPFSGAGYMQLFGPAYQAVRASSPTVTIVTAGLAPTSTQSFSIDDRDYLNQMYAAGLGQYADVVVGVHPYGWGNAPDARCCGSRGWDEDPHFYYLETLDAYRAIMNQNGHSGAPMWITEFGYASWDGFPLDPPQEWMKFNDRWAQGGYTIRAIQIAQERGDVGIKVLWNLNFAVLSGLIGGRDERAAYSMLVPGDACQINPDSPNHTERPIFWMLFDAVHPDQALPDWCGVPPNGIPGLG
ncbi:MAG: cellulase family glycosylhydrolase [Anaerolineae bacterium]|nr:cellulase family glycosylhydrolase [Anaerolineae bacterium]